MGWRPKPGALRAIDGTRRGDRLNPNEPMPEVGVPECPAFVVGAAREHWNALAGELADAGLLTVLDGAAFALDCVAHARWLAAERELAHRTVRAAQTLSVLARQTRADVQRAGAELGLGR